MGDTLPCCTWCVFDPSSMWSQGPLAARSGGWRRVLCTPRLFWNSLHKRLNAVFHGSSGCRDTPRRRRDDGREGSIGSRVDPTVGSEEGGGPERKRGEKPEGNALKVESSWRSPSSYFPDRAVVLYVWVAQPVFVSRNRKSGSEMTQRAMRSRTAELARPPCS